MDLILLFWTYLAIAPTNNFTGFDDAGHVQSRISFHLCQTARFESHIRTNGVFVLQVQIAPGTNNSWENFGEPITGPSTNVQVLSVPSTNTGNWVYRLWQR